MIALEWVQLAFIPATLIPLYTYLIVKHVRQEKMIRARFAEMNAEREALGMELLRRGRR